MLVTMASSSSAPSIRNISICSSADTLSISWPREERYFFSGDCGARVVGWRTKKVTLLLFCDSPVC